MYIFFAALLIVPALLCVPFGHASLLLDQASADYARHALARRFRPAARGGISVARRIAVADVSVESGPICSIRAGGSTWRALAARRP